MTKTLKIKLDTDPNTGEQKMPPECFRLMVAMAEHRDICDECLKTKNKGGFVEAPCSTYRAILDDLLKQPEVQLVDP